MRAPRAVLIAIATIAAATGCNLILDNQVHELSPDATAGQGGAGRGGVGGTGELGGVAGIGGLGGIAGIGGIGIGGVGIGGIAGVLGVGGTGGATGGSGGSSGGGSGGTSGGGSGGASGGGSGGSSGRDAGVDDGAAGTFSRDVLVGDASDASDATGGADGGIQDAPYDAADACTPNTTECRDRSVYLCTPGGQWVEILQCSAACVSGACTGSCVPGTVQCTGNTPQTCDNTGKWQSGTVCPFVCTQGMCTGTCVPGNTITCGDVATCNDGAVQTCDTTGTLGPCTPAPSNCATVPVDWNPVAMGDALGSCPSGFQNPTTYYTSATGAPFTCSCGCSGTQSCAGSVTLNEYTDVSACAGVPMPPISTRYVTISPTCTIANNGQIDSGHGYMLTEVNYTASPECFPNPHPTNTPPVITQNKTVCWPSLTCGSGACLSSNQAANLCVYKAGMNACPQGYPNSTVMSSSYDDMRTCGACSCGSQLNCTLSNVLFDNSYSCAAGPNFYMYASTTCNAAAFTYPANAVQAMGTSVGDPNCVEKTPSMSTGDVQLSGWGIVTVCCK